MAKVKKASLQIEDTPFLIYNFQLSTFNFQLLIILGVPANTVGLSAISFSAMLQKDTASIPNALWEREIKLRRFNVRLLMRNH